MNTESTSPKLIYEEITDYTSKNNELTESGLQKIQQAAQPTLQITKDQVTEMDILHGWCDMTQKVSEAPSPSLQSVANAIPVIFSPEQEKLYNEFVEGSMDLTASQIFNPTEIEREATDLRNEQELFLKTLSRALFTHYVKDMTGPITKTLTDTFADDDLMESLKPHLQETFSRLFFPDPSNINPTSKSLLTSILYWTEKFFEGLNQSIKALGKIEAGKGNGSSEQLILDAFVQKLYAEGTIPLNSKNVHEVILLLLQEIITKRMFGKPTIESLNSVEKIGVILSSKLTDRFIQPLCSIKVLNLFMVRALEGTLSVHNPFDRPMPSLKQFDASDVVFSNEIDARVRTIATQVIHLAYGDSPIKRKGAEVLLKFIPKIGTKVQQGLNRIFNSGSTLMPGIIIAQFLFEGMPGPGLVKEVKTAAQQSTQNKALRDLYMQSLADPNPTYQFSKIEKELEKYAWVKESLLGNDTKRIERLLSNRLPFGTQSKTLKLMQTVYKFAQHDLFMQLFLLHILKGISNGIRPS